MGTTATALAGLSIHESVANLYDSVGRKVRTTHSSGGAIQALTQFSYDASDRLICTAVRMNPAAFGGLPASACSLGTEGSQGPDRIERNFYDPAGQLLRVERAVGTPLVQDYARYSYSPNGKQTSVTDANGNKASMTYDGFDRQIAWNFPSTSTPGQVSTTDYEAYGYDPNGNRTSLRKRDGRVIIYAYDALNRMTSKIIPEGSGLPASATRDVYYGYDLRGLQLYARFDSPTGEGIHQHLGWPGANDGVQPQHERRPSHVQPSIRSQRRPHATDPSGWPVRRVQSRWSGADPHRCDERLGPAAASPV